MTEIQLSDVTDADRFRIIDLYKESGILWCKGSGGRDKIIAAWNEITEEMSTPDRKFSVPLAQKLIKNLRDQYIRLLRRRCNSNWKFQTALQFLGIDPPPQSKTPKKSNGQTKPKADKLPKRQKISQITPISFVKVEEKPLPTELPPPIEKFIRPVEKLVLEPSKMDEMIEIAVCSVVKEQMVASSSENSQASSSKIVEKKDSNVLLSDVTEFDRLKIIELYKQRPELWNKNSGVPREKIAEAWEYITDRVSSDERRFSVQLVQKITKNLKDQYIRLLRRGVEHSNWKYLDLLSFLGQDHSSKKSTERHDSDNKKSKSNNQIKKVEKSSIINQETQEPLTNNIWPNLSLLSLTMPFIPLQTTASAPIAPLTTANLKSAQAEFFRKYPEQMCRNTMNNSREAMIAAWSMMVGAYMNRQ